MAAILFVCTGNTCRSSMAAAIAGRLQEEQGLDIRVASAGLAAPEGAPATPEAIQAVAEMGIDLSQHRARQVTAAMVAGADLVLTMTAGQRDYLRRLYPEAGARIFTLKEYAREGRPGSRDAATPAGGGTGAAEGAAGAGGALDDDIPDPIGRPLDVYRATARQLAELIGQALTRLRPAGE